MKAAPWRKFPLSLVMGEFTRSGLAVIVVTKAHACTMDLHDWLALRASRKGGASCPR